VGLNVTAADRGRQELAPPLSERTTVSANWTIDSDVPDESYRQRIGIGGQVCLNGGTVSSAPSRSDIILGYRDYPITAGLGPVAHIPAARGQILERMATRCHRGEDTVNAGNMPPYCEIGMESARRVWSLVVGRGHRH
jgi:hypothetical protein